MRAFLWILACILSHSALSGQTAVYDIYLGSTKVGTQTVRQFKKNDHTYVEVKGDATLNLGFKYHLNIYQLSQFDGDKLIMSEALISKNQDIYNSTKTEWKGNNYLINHNQKISNHKAPINYYSTQLYFNEPASFSEVYSETDCVLRSIEQTSPHSYKVVKSSFQRYNEYAYKEGVLQTAITRNVVVDLTIKLISYHP